MWNHFKLYDIIINPVLVNNLRKEFDNFLFGEEVKIIDRVLELQRLQTLLSRSTKRVLDEDLKSKLLSALPSTNYWHGVKVKATED